MDEQGAKLRHKKEGWGVNTRTGDLRGIQKHCPSMQG